MNAFRPSLSTDQIDALKTDIKLLSRVIKDLANCKRFPVLTIQNEVAKRMGFTSFSELTQRAKRPHNDLVPFLLFEEVSVVDLGEIYGHSFDRYFPSAIIDIQDRLSPTKTVDMIGATIFKRAYDEGEINGELLNLDTGLPSSGKVSAEHPRFNGFFEGDLFKVYFNNVVTTYTVMEKSRMMDTDLSVLIVQEGHYCATPSGAFRIS